MTSLNSFKSLEKVCEDMHITCPVEPEKRTELREAIINKERSWAKTKLHLEFGWECLDKWCQYCGFHSSAEIAGEKNQE